jgi:hypothetical protein
MVKNNRMSCDRKQRLQLISRKRQKTFGTSNDNGRNRVPRLGPPTIIIALLSPILKWKKLCVSVERKVKCRICLEYTRVGPTIGFNGFDRRALVLAGALPCSIQFLNDQFIYIPLPARALKLKANFQLVAEYAIYFTGVQDCGRKLGWNLARHRRSLHQERPWFRGNPLYRGSLLRRRLVEAYS